MLYEMVVGSCRFRSEIDDRLTSSPVPPRELDQRISPQLQEVIYRAIEREPAEPLCQRERVCEGPDPS